MHGRMSPSITCLGTMQTMRAGALQNLTLVDPYSFKFLMHICLQRSRLSMMKDFYMSWQVADCDGRRPIQHATLESVRIAFESITGKLRHQKFFSHDVIRTGSFAGNTRSMQLSVDSIACALYCHCRTGRLVAPLFLGLQYLLSASELFLRASNVYCVATVWSHIGNAMLSHLCETVTDL